MRAIGVSPYNYCSIPDRPWTDFETVALFVFIVAGCYLLYSAMNFYEKMKEEKLVRYVRDKKVLSSSVIVYLPGVDIAASMLRSIEGRTGISLVASPNKFYRIVPNKNSIDEEVVPKKVLKWIDLFSLSFEVCFGICFLCVISMEYYLRKVYVIWNFDNWLDEGLRHSFILIIIICIVIMVGLICTWTYSNVAKYDIEDYITSKKHIDEDVFIPSDLIQYLSKLGLLETFLENMEQKHNILIYLSTGDEKISWYKIHRNKEVDVQ